MMLRRYHITKEEKPQETVANTSKDTEKKEVKKSSKKKQGDAE